MACSSARPPRRHDGRRACPRPIATGSAPRCRRGPPARGLAQPSSARRVARSRSARAHGARRSWSGSSARRSPRGRRDRAPRRARPPPDRRRAARSAADSVEVVMAVTLGPRSSSIARPCADRSRARSNSPIIARAAAQDAEDHRLGPPVAGDVRVSVSHSRDRLGDRRRAVERLPRRSRSRRGRATRRSPSSCAAAITRWLACGRLLVRARPSRGWPSSSRHAMREPDHVAVRSRTTR